MGSNDTIGFDIQGRKTRSLRYGSLISPKWAKLGHMLLLNTNNKSDVGSPLSPSHLNLCDLEKSNSNSLRFWPVLKLYVLLATLSLISHLHLPILYNCIVEIFNEEDRQYIAAYNTIPLVVI